MRKTLTLFLIIILNSGAYCQDKNVILESITKNFQRYCESFPREEVFMETDRDIYIAGEAIWFSIWLFDRQKEALSYRSKIAYVEILNQFNRPVLQKKVGLDKGNGSGQVILADTLSSGIYTLRAYTNWMKNFMPGNCFSRKLKIFNVSGEKDFFVPEEPERTLPKYDSVKNGISISIDAGKDGFIEAGINADNEYRVRNNNICYLFVQTHGVINYSTIVILKDDVTLVKIPASYIIPGINQFTVFDSTGKPACIAYLYTPHGESDLLRVNIILPDSCRSREQVSIGLETVDPFSSGDTATLSISVVPAGTKAAAGIADYLVFGSEFGQLPDRFTETALDNIPDSTMDDFLSRTKSRWIDWDLILYDSLPDIKYQAETRHHYLYGNTFNNHSTDISGNRYIFLSATGKNATFQYSRIRQDGSFSFSMPADNNTRDLVIQTEKQEANNKIIVASSFSNRYPDINLRGHSETVLPAVVPKLALNYRVMKIYRTFEPRVAKDQLILTGGTRRFYGRPDVELMMTDYITLPTMQEVFFELLPGVAIRYRYEGYQVTIRDPSDSRIYENPLLLIDGVFIRNPALIAEADPQLVEKIDVIKSRYIVGDCTFCGLVNLISKKGDLCNITLPEDAVRIRYKAFEPAEEFISPDYSITEKRQSHVPDFRNTLYWKVLPSSDLSNQIRLEFTASDFVSDYDVIIHGVTQNGSFISQKTSIKIRK